MIAGILVGSAGWRNSCTIEVQMLILNVKTIMLWVFGVSCALAAFATPIISSTKQ
jgi:hypothetical protein